jgi:hypothetical protein
MESYMTDYLIILTHFYERKAVEVLSLVLHTCVSDPDRGWILAGPQKSKIGRNIMFEELVVGLEVSPLA